GGGGGESGDVYEGKEDSKLPDVFDAHETDEIEADSFDVHDFGDESNYDEAGYPGEYGEEEAGGDEDGEAEPYDGDIAGVETFVPCYKDSDCDDNDPCTVDKCDPQTGVCASEKKECAAVHLCFIPACGKEGYCFHSPEMSEGCYAELKFGEDFEEADFSNWTVDDLVKNTGEGETPVVWNLDAKRSLSGKQSAYFGIKEKYDFDNGKIVASSLTSPAMKVESPSRIILLFWAYLDVEEGEYWDILSVNVISGEKTIPVWAKKYGTPSKEWFPVEIDLTAFRGIEFSISFVFNSVDDSYNDLEGIYIDGVNLLATGKGAGCVNDGECADSLACTKESCGNGACVYEIAENCCTTDADCDDFDFCTINI
ncbi:MAG: hypothetical protein FJ088_16145, partial [Deltaproteobacteria bacterium]|nr:hypothetical protein [Deltaproteobacteria bacterium]